MQRPIKSHQVITREWYLDDQGRQAYTDFVEPQEELQTYSNVAATAPYNPQQRGSGWGNGRPQFQQGNAQPSQPQGQGGQGAQGQGQQSGLEPPVQEFDLEEGETLLRGGDRCFGCGGRGHYAQNCMYKDSLNRLDLRKLAALPARKCDCIVERALKWGSLSRRSTQNQNQWIYELKQLRSVNGTM